MDKKIIIAALVLLLCAVCFAGCDGVDPVPTVPTGPAEYNIFVTDYKGDVPTFDVLVEVKRNGETVGMKKAKDGVAAFTLERGDYTFVPSAAGGEFYYDETLCTLNATKTEATVAIYERASGSSTIYPSFDDPDDRRPYNAAHVKEGAVYVEIDRNDVSYYIFTPTRGGIYKISCPDKDITLGYYGDANAVRSDDIAKLDENGAFQFEVKNGSIGTELSGALRIVIGIKGSSKGSAVIVIERIGAPEKEVSWNNISASQLPSTFEKTDVLNHKLVDISVTDRNVKVAYNNSDGYYHYGDENGPVVYMRISSSGRFLNSFIEICETAMMCRIYYGIDGKVSQKDGYNEMIADYGAICDGNGVVPLTEELAKMIKNVGEHSGWWDFSEKGNDIFTYDYATGEATGINEGNIVMENAWLFACCYVEKNVSGSEKTPIALTVSDTLTYNIELEKDQPVYCTVTASAVFMIEEAVGITVKYGDKTYKFDKNSSIVFETLETGTLVITADKDCIISFTYKLNA